jgi:hypothetical protein
MAANERAGRPRGGIRNAGPVAPQFDAPVSLVLTCDRVLDPGAVRHFDLGALCYVIVLAAWDRGLGSVINGQGIMRSDIVRQVAAIPDDEVIMTCVAMGYPDRRDRYHAPAMRCRAVVIRYRSAARAPLRRAVPNGLASSNR